MTSDILISFPVFLQIAVLSVLLFLCVRRLLKDGHSLTVVFLTFLFAVWLFVDLYWVIYDYMRPDRRMPFAVNEIGELAILLMVSAIIRSAVPFRLNSAKKQAVGAGLFAAGNVVLWIAWSGEWMQDILSGAAFAFCLCCAACALKNQRRLGMGEWIALAVGCAALLLAQGCTFFAGDRIRPALELGCYVFLAVVTLYWVYKLILAHKKQAPPNALLSLAAAMVCWLTTAKFMSEGYWYTAFMTFESVGLTLLYLTGRKAVNEA